MGGFAITGIDQTVRMLEEAPRNIVARAYLKAGEAAGNVIAEELYNRAPERDEGERDETKPHLKDTVAMEVVLDSQFRGVLVRAGFTSVGAHVANWLEYGHRLIGHEPGLKDIGYVEPHPFVRAAADASAARAIEAFTSVLDQEIASGSVVKAA